MSIHRDTQWPCPNTFHIGTKDEWQKIYDILTVTFGLPQTYATPKTYLKMPPSSALSNGSGTIAAGTTGYYWASTTLSWNDTRAYVVTFSTSAFNITGFAKSNGMSVRPFADTAVIPDSSRTVLYDWAEYATWMSIYDPGVYYNSTLWLISLSDDWVDWTSIADKNVWATEVYSGTVSAANSWGFFQRWNNYMFPYTGATTTSSTKANASNFWPWNYFNRPTFITTTSAGGLDWSDPSNNNLWWGVTNWTRESVPVFVSHWHIWTWSMEWIKDTQWPCSNGFHVPTDTEWTNLVNAWIDIWVWASWWWDDFRKKMLMPFAWYRSSTSPSPKNQWVGGYYWASTVSGTGAYYLKEDAASLTSNTTITRSNWASLRPFANNPVNPLNGEILQEGWIPIDWNLFFGEVIARNETLWLISLTYNEWHDCITIADKNLWATEAYYWDIRDSEAVEPTLSQANCGYYFQWWNNYWFPWTGSVATSTAQVNASSYWPWNYYSSSTFRYYPIGNRDWCSPKNDNLWGWVTNGEWYKRK